MNILPVTDDTVGLWPFQGSLVDIGPNGLHFTQATGESLGKFTFPVSGQPFVMMTQDWNNTPLLQTPTSALLKINGAITVSWLFVQNDMAEDYFWYAEDGSAHPFGAHFVGNKLNWLQNSTNTAFAAGATDPISTLHFGTLVRDALNNVSYYQDGVLIGTVAVGAAVGGATPRLYCGYLSRGKIASLRILNRAQTAMEVAADYAYVFSDAPTPPEPGPSEHPNALGSMDTGSIGVDTGSDSVDTACGTCAVAPPDLITDGASMQTGSESIDTATNPSACGSGIISAPPAGFLWLRADDSLPAYMTKNGSDQLSRWINQFPPAIDVEAQNVFGVPTPNSQRPVYMAGLAPNGRGGLHLDGSKSQFLLKRYPNGTLNQPTADGEPLLIMAVVRPSAAMVDNTFYGTALTMRHTNEDLECSLRRADIFLYGKVQIPMSSAQNAHAHYIGTGTAPYPNGTAFVTDYGNQMLLMTWQWLGVGNDPNSVVRINGAGLPEFTFSATAMLPYDGVSGYAVGFCNANAGSYWDGDLFEFLGYRGADALDPDIYHDAFQYLNQGWSLNLFPPT